MTENHLPMDKLLTRKQAAEFLGVTSHTLAVWASCQRYDLPYIKIGRLAKYRMSDLITFINRNEKRLAH